MRPTAGTRCRRLRRLIRSCAALLGLLAMMGRGAAGGFVRPEEMAQKDRWVKAHLLECLLKPVPLRPPKSPSKPEPGLTVLANNDPVIRNERAGQPLRLGNTPYTRGLYCHAVSKIVVRLPGPGKTFTAVVGLDRNDDTLRGKGSVVFRVSVGGEVRFTSPVMRVDTPPRDVRVDLAGAQTFTLEIGDAGDGIGWDQADWADAKVTLADGKEIWLGDLPLCDERSPPMGPAMLVRTSNLPFAFVYAGQPSDGLLAAWPIRTDSTRLDAGRTRHTLTWTDPRTGLEVRCLAVAYSDFPVVEWTVTFRNTGRQDTPILENVQGLDARLGRTSDGEVVLRFPKGDTCRPDLYEPQEVTLAPHSQTRFAPAGGRPTNGAFPYYNLQTAGGGLIFAVGWPGQWATTFTRDGEPGLRITAGQELTHLVLRPGEQVRTPLIALLFWEGTAALRAQNLWRRWMWAHNVPRTADGNLPPAILHGNTSGQFHEMTRANEQNQTQFIDRYREERIGITFWWMDAGWYPCEGHWPRTGTWEPDPERFPNGLRAISEHARARGVKTLVWFEPERVADGTWLAENHPEWLLGPLLNLGNPDAGRWLTDHVDRVIRRQSIDLYRQDFNMDPLGCWRGADEPDRRGMTENLHVQGYLAYWDELRRRHPNLIIDSCASGGRRNDLETMRRAVALHPTDYNYGDLPVKQAFHFSLLQWLPYFGSNTVPVNTVTAYAFRSGHAMSVVLGYDLRRKDLDYARLRRLAREWRQIVPYYRGDFYPLTPYSRDERHWIAWQFHRPETDDGLVQAFRRADSDEAAAALRLHALRADAVYAVTDLDAGTPKPMTGNDLMQHGLPVEIAHKPGAAVITYTRLK